MRLPYLKLYSRIDNVLIAMIDNIVLYFDIFIFIMCFQAIDRGENLTILADKTETLRSQVSKVDLG